MIKLPCLFAALGLLLCLDGRAEEDILDRRVPLDHEFADFDGAVRLMWERTGCEVICPPELAALLKKTPNFPGGIYNISINNQSTIPARDFPGVVCGHLHVDWKLDGPARTITLDWPWRRPDARSAADLLAALGRPPLPASFSRDPAWPQAFDALLSQPQNFALAAPVRQLAIYWTVGQEVGNMRPLYVGPVVSADREKFTLVLISQPPFLTKASGSMSCYWFRADGALAGAGLMDVGLDRFNISATVEGSDGEPSTLVFVAQEVGETKTYTARCVLESTGLKVTSYVDEQGQPVPTRPLGVGDSLLLPAE